MSSNWFASFSRKRKIAREGKKTIICQGKAKIKRYATLLCLSLIKFHIFYFRLRIYFSSMVVQCVSVSFDITF